MNAEAVQAVAEALAKHWRDMHTNESLGLQRMLATHAVAAAEPHLTREAKAAAERAEEEANLASADVTRLLGKIHDIAAERKTLAARLAAVEALADDAGCADPQFGKTCLEVESQARYWCLPCAIRAALATGATTNQQEGK